MLTQHQGSAATGVDWSIGFANSLSATNFAFAVEGKSLIELLRGQVHFLTDALWLSGFCAPSPLEKRHFVCERVLIHNDQVTTFGLSLQKQYLSEYS